MNSDATALDLAQERLRLSLAARTSRRAALESLRDLLAGQLEANPEQPALVAQFRATMADLDSLPLADGLGVIDELARKREVRESAAGGAAAEGAAPSADVLLNGG